MDVDVGEIGYSEIGLGDVSISHMNGVLIILQRYAFSWTYARAIGYYWISSYMIGIATIKVVG